MGAYEKGEKKHQAFLVGGKIALLVEVFCYGK